MISNHQRMRWLALCLLTVAVAATAQPVLTIPDSSGRKGDTLLIPVVLSGIGANNLYSIQATVDLGSSHATVVGVTTSGTLTAGASPTWFGTTRRLAVAWTTPIASDGILFYLQVALTGTPGNTVTLGLSSVLLNEGSPAATVDPGSIRLRAVSISPRYLNNVAMGDSVAFTVTGDVVLPLSWSTSAPAVGTVDASGWFRTAAPGFVTVYVTDGEGKRDSTSTFSVVPNVIKSLTLWIPDTSRMQTLEIDVPVRVTTVTGLGITSAQFRVTFAASALEYRGVISAGGLASQWGAPVVNSVSPGVLEIAFAGSDTISGAGTLLWVRFRVKPTAAGTSTIGLSNATFNETITPALDPGDLTVTPSPSIVIATSRRTALKGDTVRVVSTTGGTAPYTFSSSSPSIASVDPLTGALTVLTRGPVTIRVVDALGFPGSSDTIRTFDFDAVLRTMKVRAGDSVEVPLAVGPTDGLGIVAFRAAFGIDTAKVRFRGIVAGGLLAANWSIETRDSAGKIVVGAFGSAPLTGSGNLFSLKLEVSSANAVGDSTIVHLRDLQFNEPTPATPEARLWSSTLTFAAPNRGGSFFFDGQGDRVRVLDSSPLNASAVPSAYKISGALLSVESWVFLTDLPGLNSEYVIVGRGAQASFGVDPYFSYALRVENFTGTPRFNLWLSTGVAGESFGTSADTVSVTPGRWYHVAGTYDGSTARLYIDGVLKQQRVSGGKQIGAGSIGFYIGGVTYGYFKGLIDEVRLWNVTRSGAQILSARDSVLVGNEAGLAGYWPLDSLAPSPVGPLAIDRSVNRNDLAVQFDAKPVAFPRGSAVQLKPIQLSLLGPGDPFYAVTGGNYRVKAVGDGWPLPGVTITTSPAGSVVAADSIFWTPAAGQWGVHPVIATMTNAAGSLTDTVMVFVEETRRAANLVGLDVTNRGKAGAFSSFGKGLFYGGKNGLGGADFSLVDRNDVRFAGGLYSTVKSFRMLSGFVNVPGRWADFTAFATSFDDALESPRVGVRVTQTTSVKSTAPDDRYVINEYRVVNTSGVALDDLFAQLTADFDIGVLTSNRGGYDSSLALSYAYEEGGATNSAYYGIVLLGRPVAGHAVFAIGADPQFVRSTGNLTAFPAIPATTSDVRNQITVGPLSMAAGDSITVAYAFVAGDDLNQIKAAAQRAREIYSASPPTFAAVLDLAVPGVQYRRRVNRNGTPPASVSAVQLPAGATLAGDTLVWTPTEMQLGFRRVILQASNIAGSVIDTTDILVEAVRSAENKIRVDLTNRGKLGAFGLYGKGIWYKGKNGGGAADFSLVDRNSSKFAGGLYSTLVSFSPDGPPSSFAGFSDTTSRLPGFTAFTTSFRDLWEPPATRIGVKIQMLGHVKNTAPDDRYVIVEYNVVNASGATVDDLFAQMTADFDVGNALANLGGYNGTLGLSYAYEPGGGTDSSYYGLALLSHPAAGHAVFVSGTDAQYVRSVTNLTTFPSVPASAGDTRNQLTAGPFTLAAGDTLRFGVAFVAADDLAQLQTAAQQARSVWGSFTTSVGPLSLAVPAKFEIAQNYPNPFNPSTVIKFGLPTESRVSVTIFDQLGRQVSTLVSGFLSAGTHQVLWDASGMASGPYFFRIEAVGASGERFVGTGKMILMK